MEVPVRNSRSACAITAVVLLLACSGTLSPGAATARAAAAQPDGQKRDVVLAVQRNHRLHVFDADTLEPLGQVVGLNNLLEHVSVSPNGRTLYLAQAATVDGNSCCALFAFDLSTREMCYLIEPAMESVPSPDGRWLFAQRGSVGIDVIDVTARIRARTIETFDKSRARENRDQLPLRGSYALYPSRDGRWMFGITLWQKPSLGIFDLSSHTMVRELPIPVSRGAWVGSQFYLHENAGRQARLLAVNPEMTELGPPLPITGSTRELTAAQLPSSAHMIATDDRLLVYQPFAQWLIRDVDAVRSPGIFVIDPASGGLTAHLAPLLQFAQVVAGIDGQRLYGLTPEGSPDNVRNDLPPRLLAVDSRTGAVLAEQQLGPDAWHLAVARIPVSLVPRGQVHPTACRAAR
jgi:hypothetical protein